MKKFYNVIKIILILLGVSVLAGYVVLYIVNKDMAKQIMDTVIDYVNRPLPVVGVSTLVVAGLVWKIFSRSAYGKKILNQTKAELEAGEKRRQEEFEEQKKIYLEIITFYQNEIDIMFDAIIQLCELSANKKMKELGENLKQNALTLKEQIRDKFNEVVNSDTEILIKSKKEMMDTIVKLVKQEMEEKYGEEGKEAVNSIAKEENL